MSHPLSRPSIVLIVAPYDSGLRQRMGRGPEWLLENGVVPRLEEAGALVERVLIELGDTYPAELEAGFFLHRAIADAATRARESNALPVVLSGNCNSGVIGCLAAAGQASHRTGLIWFDAHGDFQTPETDPDGFLDSMGLAMAMGRCWRGPLQRLDGFTPVAPRRALLVAARDFDPGEREALTTAGVLLVATEDVGNGDGNDFARSVHELAGRVDEVHLHLDLDAHDADWGRANGWAVAGGLTGARYLGAVEAVFAHCRVASVSLASFDPASDHDGRIGASALRLLATCASAKLHP